MPASETILCQFVALLAETGLRLRTIKVYLSAVCFLHIEEGHGDPSAPSLHRLHYTLQGIKRAETVKGTERRERLPISPDILRKIKGVWEMATIQPDTKMLWAACCLGFFRFLRSSEMTVPSQSGYDPDYHLSYSDIAVDSPKNLQVMRVSIKQSKTDPFRKGIDLYMGRTSTDICVSGEGPSELLGGEGKF